MAHEAREVFIEDNQREIGNVRNSDLATSTHEQLKGMPKIKFMQDFEQGITIEESRKKVHVKIDNLWSKSSSAKAIVSPILEQTIMPKTQFEIDCEDAITLEELREGLY